MGFGDFYKQERTGKSHENIKKELAKPKKELVVSGQLYGFLKE